MILLRNHSRVRVGIEQGANTEDNEEYRESVRFEVHQGNGLISSRVKRLQYIALEISSRDRIDARNLSFVKAIDINRETYSQVACTK